MTHTKKLTIKKIGETSFEVYNNETFIGYIEKFKPNPHQTDYKAFGIGRIGLTSYADINKAANCVWRYFVGNVEF